MKINPAVIISLGWLATAMLQPGLAQSYTIIDLGTPGPAGSASEAHGINQSGAVVGTWWPVGSRDQRAFFYQWGTNTDAGTLSPGTYAIAYGVNNASQAVGQSTTSGSFNKYHAFSYSNSVMTDLGAIGGNWSSANAINQSGGIAGETTVDNSGSIHAFLYAGGRMADLGLLPNGDYSSAHGLNDLGVMVGQASQITAGVTNQYAFVYSNGVMLALGTLGGNYGNANAINNAGQIVGESSLATGDTHAFLYSGGMMKDLGTFGGSYSTACAVNSSGKAVGYALTPAGDAHAFLYDGSTLLDLNNLISPSAGWASLISANGINDYGQITGSGYTINGDYHAFLLSPPVTLSLPASLAGGQIAITAEGVAGQSFVLQVSTNLLDWVSISTNTLAGNSLACVDPTASSNAWRFYRALPLAP